MSRAACAETDVDVFFPVGPDPWYEAAKAVCATCPVRTDCLNHALAGNVKHGVWGGLDPKERKRLRRGQRAGARTAA